MSTYNICNENNEQKVLSKDELINYINTENDNNKQLALKDLYCEGCLFSFWIDNEINAKVEDIIAIHEEIKVREYVEAENSVVYQLNNERILLLDTNETASEEFKEFMQYQSAKLLCSCQLYLFVIDDENNPYYYSFHRVNQFLEFVCENVTKHVENIVKVKCSYNCFSFLKNDGSCFFFHDSISGIKEYFFEEIEDIYSNNDLIVLKKKNGIFTYLYNEIFMELPQETEKIELFQHYVIAVFRESGLRSFPKNIEILETIDEKVISISSHGDNIHIINEEGIIKNINIRTKSVEKLYSEIKFERVLCMGDRGVAIEKDEIYLFDKNSRFRKIYKHDYTEFEFTQNEKYEQLAHILSRDNVLDMMYISDYLIIKTNIYNALILNKKQLEEFFN